MNCRLLCYPLLVDPSLVRFNCAEEYITNAKSTNAYCACYLFIQYYNTIMYINIITLLCMSFLNCRWQCRQVTCPWYIYTILLDTRSIKSTSGRCGTNAIKGKKVCVSRTEWKVWCFLYWYCKVLTLQYLIMIADRK